MLSAFWLYLLLLSIPSANNIPRQEAPRLMLVEWFDKLRLLFEKCFPNKQLRWFVPVPVYEIQQLPICIHLQAMAHS